jgi:hypothetical protein
MSKACLFAAAALMLVSGAATAHSWYPKECCHDKDCRPVPCAELSYQDRDVVWRKHVYFSVIKGRRLPRLRNWISRGQRVTERDCAARSARQRCFCRQSRRSTCRLRDENAQRQIGNNAGVEAFLDAMRFTT